MAADSYSFLDVVALPGVRERFGRGDTLLLLSTGLDEVLWANGEGASLFGFAAIDDLLDAPSPIGSTARRQIAATSGFPAIGANRSVSVRLTSGAGSRAVPFRASTLALPDGAEGILLSLPHGDAAPAAAARRALAGIDQPGQAAAIVSAEGGIVAASAEFDGFGLTRELLRRLVAKAAEAPGQPLKQKVQAGDRILPAGVAVLDADASLVIVTEDDFLELPDDVISDAEAERVEFGAGDPSSLPSADEGSAQEEDQPGVEILLDDADDWYFNAGGEPEHLRPETRETRLAALQASPPVRFSWRTDPEGRFASISPEFAALAGLDAGALIGSSFGEVAASFGIRGGEQVAELLDGRDTWSGLTVLWPVSQADAVVPVDLAALPTYSRSRSFEGFRGFGVARTADAAPFAASEALAGDTAGSDETVPASDAVAATVIAGTAEADAPTTLKDESDRVVQLLSAVRPASGDTALSPDERDAFLAIGARLKGEDDETPAVVETGNETQNETSTAQNAAVKSAAANAEAISSPASGIIEEEDVSVPTDASISGVSDPAGQFAPVGDPEGFVEETASAAGNSLSDRPSAPTSVGAAELQRIEPDGELRSGADTSSLDSVGWESPERESAVEPDKPAQGADPSSRHESAVHEPLDKSASKQPTAFGFVPDSRFEDWQSAAESLPASVTLEPAETEPEGEEPVAAGLKADKSGFSSDRELHSAFEAGEEGKAVEAAISAEVVVPHSGEDRSDVTPADAEHQNLDVLSFQREDFVGSVGVEEAVTGAQDAFDLSHGERSQTISGLAGEASPALAESMLASETVAPSVAEDTDRLGSGVDRSEALDVDASREEDTSAAGMHQAADVSDEEREHSLDAPPSKAEGRVVPLIGRSDAVIATEVSSSSGSDAVDAAEPAPAVPAALGEHASWEDDDAATGSDQTAATEPAASASGEVSSAIETEGNGRPVGSDSPAQDAGDGLSANVDNGRPELGDGLVAGDLTESQTPLNGSGQDAVEALTIEGVSDDAPADAEPQASALAAVETPLVEGSDDKTGERTSASGEVEVAGPGEPASPNALQDDGAAEGTLHPAAVETSTPDDGEARERFGLFGAGVPLAAVDDEHDGDNGASRRLRPDTSILDRLPVPVLIHSGDLLHYANPDFLALADYPSLRAFDEAGGLGCLFTAPWERIGDEGDRQLRLRTGGGAEFPVQALLRTVPWGEAKALLLVLRKLEALPARDTAEAAVLGQRLSEMRAIIDTATDGVVLFTLDGTIRSLSRPAEALFGLDSSAAAGLPFGALFAAESQRIVTDYLRSLAGDGLASLLNDGREVIGREAKGGFIPLFMTVGSLPEGSGFCAVLRDITQWKRAEEELVQSRALAERASSHKTDFLARVSHEIRTPLNAIIGFSELMLDEKFGPVGSDRYRDYLRDINRSGSHVLDLVNDLLDISKIEAGQQEMSYEAVALNDALSEAVATMQPQANRERVIIRSSFASRLPDVVADPRSMRQIALNVLSNAIRFTQAGGQVIVSTAYGPSGDVVMRVRDTGIGMSQAEIEQALKPFKQINSLKRSRGDGTGLGLPLTKAMVEANRARFAISSDPGIGTMVEVTFPATRVLAD